MSDVFGWNEKAFTFVELVVRPVELHQNNLYLHWAIQRGSVFQECLNAFFNPFIWLCFCKFMYTKFVLISIYRS